MEEQYYMKEALKEAKKAYKKGEVPVGAVIVKNGEIIARGYNLKEIKNDTTKHAEMIAIQKASKKLRSMEIRRMRDVCHIRAMYHVCRSNNKCKDKKSDNRYRRSKNRSMWFSLKSI